LFKNRFAWRRRAGRRGGCGRFAGDIDEVATTAKAAFDVLPVREAAQHSKEAKGFPIVPSKIFETWCRWKQIEIQIE
jgi:hypothetical protein